MTVIKKYNDGTSAWETIVVGKQGATGPEGPAGATGPEGAPTPEPVKIPFSNSNGGFSTGGVIHTVPAGFSDKVYLYGSAATVLDVTLIISEGQDPFNPNANGEVYSIAVQSDGKILLGGTFATIGGVTRNSIARLNANGTLDTEFNASVDGVMGGQLYSIAVQSDGKILLGGFFDAVNGVTRYGIARLNTDGTLDTGFSSNAGNFDTVNSIVVQSDGKILLGGTFATIGGVTRNSIARLNADGTLDTGFNPNANDTVFSIAVQSDGKILLGGSFTTIGGVTRNRIARLNADGTLDTGFNPNVNSSVNNSAVNSIAAQPDGKILLGGQFTTVSGVTRNHIARLNADGTLDTGFNPNANGEVYPIAVQSDGKILLGGFFTTIGSVGRNYIARLNADGTLDTGFDPNADSGVNSIAAQPDGKILLGGQFTTVSGVTRNHIARVNQFGTLDVVNALSFSQTGAKSFDAMISDYDISSGLSLITLTTAIYSGFVFREAN